MGFKCGIVGLPNVGKSTLFNALTAAGVPSENYPFCTIKPNTGVVQVPDERLDAVAGVIQPQRVYPAIMEFVDIAGLVKGASKGEGRGNEFLSTIRETHAIAHVVRCFDDDEITHVAGRVDPVSDVEVIETELALADLETVERALDRNKRRIRTNDKEAKALHALYERVFAQLDQGIGIREMELSEGDLEDLQDLHLITAKPTMYIANVADVDDEANPHLAALRAHAAQSDALVLPLCATIEAELSEFEPEEKAEFLEELGMKEPGLHRFIRAGYELLGLISFFTGRAKEVRAWTIPRGTTAYDAAGKIHTDFQRGFIRAEVVKLDDFIEYQGRQLAREKGKISAEGKQYIVEDGDIIEFRFNV